MRSKTFSRRDSGMSSIPSKEAKQLLQEGKGWRCGLEAVTRVSEVFRFEVEELGNVDMLDQLMEALDLDTRPTIAEAISILDKRFGRNSTAVWLGTKENVMEMYCQEGEEPFDISLKGAVLISDLGLDGQLFLWPGLPFQGEVKL